MNHNQDQKNKKSPFNNQKGHPKKAPKKQPPINKNVAWIVAMLFSFVILSSIFDPTSKIDKEISISDLGNKTQSGEVRVIQITNDTDIIATLNNEEKVKSTLRKGDSLKDYNITPDKTTIEVKYNNSSAVFNSYIQTFLPIIIILGLILYLFRASSGANMKAMSFGQSKAKLSNMSKVRFKDVAGLKEAKQELSEEVDFLKNPGKFISLGAEIPKGVLLVGPPGTGKTLLAKAVAGEAGVPFYTISASEFVEMFVGVGASRVRDLFAKAKKTSPCIIFIDELDAIGRQRGAGLGGGHDEREQTLNQILVEMDGFDTDQGVIVMAATNRPDVLDAALLRPGRFDRRVVIDLPTKSERLEVLNVYKNNKPLADNINLDAIASQTAGLSPADLKNIMNEAAILTARKDQTTITQEIIHEAVEKTILGAERPSRILSEKEKKITAVHEAGHSIVGHVLPNTDDIHKVSIISRGMALGLTWSLPKEDKHLISKNKFEDELAMLLAGRLAEMIYFQEPTTGASNDLKRATQMARQMVTDFGMSERLGLRTYGEHHDQVFLGRSIGEEKDYSETIAVQIDEEVSRIIKEAENKAKDILIKYKGALEHLTELLLEKETVSGENLAQLLSTDTGIVKDGLS